MLSLNNGISAKKFREAINYNFSNIKLGLENNQEKNTYNSISIDDLQALVLQQETQIQKLKDINKVQQEANKKLFGVIDINETHLIKTTHELSLLEDRFIELENMINKPSSLKKLWKWITLTDGVSTPKQQKDK